MANEEHLAKLKEGVEAWNKWRSVHLDIVPDLEKADLRGAQLQDANLIGVQLEGANLREAEFQGANLKGAQLQGVNLRGAAFDTVTRLNGVILSEDKYGAVSVADISWGEVNLSVVDWERVKLLGDEQIAQIKTGHGKTESSTERLNDYRTAVRANRQLAVVLRNQGLNEEADRFAYRAQKLQRVVLRRQAFLPKMKLWKRAQKLGTYLFSGFLDLLAGYGYHPAKTLLWYLLVISGFTTLYATFGHLPLVPDAFVFSFMSFHGRGFFPSLSSETNLHNPLVIFAAAEAVIGLFIEISFIATFTQRFFGR